MASTTTLKKSNAAPMGIVSTETLKDIKDKLDATMEIERWLSGGNISCERIETVFQFINTIDELNSFKTFLCRNKKGQSSSSSSSSSSLAVVASSETKNSSEKKKRKRGKTFVIFLLALILTDFPYSGHDPSEAISVEGAIAIDKVSLRRTRASKDAGNINLPR
jgi:hypothetical protein